MYTTLILATFIGLISAFCASHRGRNVFIWFIIGVLFGIIGLLFLFILPDLKKKPKKIIEVQLNDGNEREVEAIAKKEIQAAALPLTDWYYMNEENEQQGALTLKEIKAQWKKGEIKKSTYVWYEEMEDWQKIYELPDLIKHLELDELPASLGDAGN